MPKWKEICNAKLWNKSSRERTHLRSASWLAADETYNPSLVGHTRVRLWVTGHSTRVCAQPPPRFSCHKHSFVLYWKWKEKKHASEKKHTHTQATEAKWQLPEYSHLNGRRSKCLTDLSDSLLLLTGNNCSEGPLLSPNLKHLASALNDPFKCYRP